MKQNDKCAGLVHLIPAQILNNSRSLLDLVDRVIEFNLESDGRGAFVK